KTASASTKETPVGDAPAQRGWWRRNWKRLVLGVFILALAGAGGAYYQFFGRIMLSEPFKRAWDIVIHNEKVKAELGEPIGGGWTPHGTLTNDNPNMPTARMTFSISGPKGTATVTANGQRVDNIWGFPDFKVAVDGGKQIDVSADLPSDVEPFNPN